MLLLIVKNVFFLVLISNGVQDGLSVEIDRRVVNGIAASNYIPYQASVRVSVRDHARFGRGHTCGGVLISRRTVTTAAHCLLNGNQRRNAFDLRVVLGSLNRHLYTRDTVIGYAERIIVHPEYRRGESFAHDIGLIILTSAVEYSYNVMSISIIDHPVEENTNCQVSGWGATEWRGSMPAKLRKANVSIVHRDICLESYGETLVDGMVCANGRSETGITDVCQGDSGGPLTCNNMLVGLASFGVGCGSSEQYPGVYVDCYYYRDWIRDNSQGTRIYQSRFHISFVLILSVAITHNK